MKLLVVLCVFAFVVLSMGYPKEHSRGCIYIMGICYEECPEGTHSYTTGCGRKTPEPTCAQPNPVQEEGEICDYSECYCDSPTVRDTTTNKCVPLEKCPKKESDKTHVNNTMKESSHTSVASASATASGI